MRSADDALWAWSVYWHSDQLQSCTPVHDSDASNKLVSTWRGFFEALPAGAVILDVGTGNGSLAAQAVEVSKTKSERFFIHGVDLADIQPQRFVSSAASLLQDVDFHPRTPMENLPFDDSHFDAVASQYAIEYSRADESLAETLRVLKPAGRFRFLLHADDGVLKERCQLQARQAETILESGLFDLVADLLKKLVKAESDNASGNTAAAMQAISALKDALDKLERGFAADENHSLVSNLFTAVRSLPDRRRSHSLQMLLTMTDDIRNLLVAQSQRLQGMQRSALDDEAATALADRLRELGAGSVTLERAVAGEQGHCIGFWLHGEKAST